MKTDQEIVNNSDGIEKKESKEKYTAYQFCNLVGINKHKRIMILRKFAKEKLTKKQWEQKIK